MDASEVALEDNVNALAQFAALCQRYGMVPIVEPEILMDGDHDLARAVHVAERVLSTTYKVRESLSFCVAAAFVLFPS